MMKYCLIQVNLVDFHFESPHKIRQASTFPNALVFFFQKGIKLESILQLSSIPKNITSIFFPNFCLHIFFLNLFIFFLYLNIKKYILFLINFINTNFRVPAEDLVQVVIFFYIQAKFY